MDASRVVIGSITNCLRRTYHRISCEKLCTPLRHGITWLFTSPLHSRLCIQSSSSAARAKERSTNDGETPTPLNSRQTSSSSSSSSQSPRSSPSLSSEPGSPLLSVPSMSLPSSSSTSDGEIGETEDGKEEKDQKEERVEKVTNKKIPDALKREWELALVNEDQYKIAFFAKIGELINKHKSHNLYAQQNAQKLTALHSMEKDNLIELRWQLENIQAPLGKCAKTALVILKSIVYILTVRALWLTIGIYLLYLATLNPKVQEKLPSQDSVLSTSSFFLSVFAWNLQNAIVTILLLYCFSRWIPNPFSRGAAQALDQSK